LYFYDNFQIYGTDKWKANKYYRSSNSCHEWTQKIHLAEVISCNQLLIFNFKKIGSSVESRPLITPLADTCGAGTLQLGSMIFPFSMYPHSTHVFRSLMLPRFHWNTHALPRAFRVQSRRLRWMRCEHVVSWCFFLSAGVVCACVC